MKEFLGEYGLVIVVVAIILIMLALGSNIGQQITSAITTKIGDLLSWTAA